MAHAPSSPPEEGPASPRRSILAILLPVSAFLSTLSKRVSHASKKLRRHHNDEKNHNHEEDDDDDDDYYYYDATGVKPMKSPRTPRTTVRRSPKELLTSMSNKAIKFIHGRKKGGVVAEEDVEEDFGDGGVWQKAILMGDRCQPLNFSGAIYYDESGRKLDQFPLRSPRASPLPGYITCRNCEVVTSEPIQNKREKAHFCLLPVCGVKVGTRIET